MKAPIAQLIAGLLHCGLFACGGGSGAGNDPDGSSTAGAAGSGGTPAQATGGSGNSTSQAGSAGLGGSSGIPGNDPADSSDAGTEELDPVPGEYGIRASLLEPNSEFGAAQIGRFIYVAGGYPATRVVQHTVQVYDTEADSWQITTQLPLAVHHSMVTSVGGLLYVIGGEVGNGSGPAVGNVNVFDPENDAWSSRAPMPTARSGGAAAVIGNKIYVVGGRPPAGNAFEVYDVSTDEWTELMRPSLAFNDRNHLIAVALGGFVYMAGGRYDGGGVGSPMTDTVERYDPALDEWTPLAPLPRPRGGVNGVVANGCFHVFGGEGTNIGEPNDVFPDHDVYNPSTDSWRSLPPLPIPVHGVTGAAFIDGLIYIPGGGTRSGGNSGSVHHQVFRPDMRCD